ncbi:MAG: hypothetical protein JXA20_18375 [Spirochaetes bacterium]|nr:hypothetical protein [Spirochaetota bacterium]
MRRYAAVCTSLVAAGIIGAAAAPADDPYALIRDREYGFSIRLPRSWKTRQVDLGYRRLILCTRDRLAEIAVTASRQDMKEIEKWDDWEEWYTQGRGLHIRRIIETKSLLLEKDMVGKILLFEYSQGNRRLLQKVLISKFGDSLVTVECRAPVVRYHRYSDVFTVVMGSLRRSE